MTQQNNPDFQGKGISLKDTRDIPCECGNIIFMPGYRFRKVSRFITGGPKDSVLPIELFLCTQCGKPLDELIPAELKDASNDKPAPSIQTPDA